MGTQVPAACMTRTPAAQPLGPACLPGWRLNFHKLAQDGSGKCSITQTGAAEDCVYGVLYCIEQAQRRALDEAEGPGFAYRSASIHMTTGLDGLAEPSPHEPLAKVSQGVDALVYIALSLNETAVPYHWYKQFVLAGAIEHGLPPHYVAQVQSIVSQDDPDTERQRINSAILG